MVAAANAGTRAEGLLRAGMEDQDSYVRRRAALALAKLQPTDAAAISIRMSRDTDPYMRQAALEMAAASNDPKHIRTIATALSSDDVAHVQAAAHRQLQS